MRRATGRRRRHGLSGNVGWTVGGNGLGRGILPRLLRRQLGRARSQQRQPVLIGIARRQRLLDPRHLLDHPPGHFDQRRADRIETAPRTRKSASAPSRASFAGAGNSRADEKPIGRRPRARGLVRSERARAAAEALQITRSSSTLPFSARPDPQPLSSPSRS